MVVDVVHSGRTRDGCGYQVFGEMAKRVAVATGERLMAGRVAGRDFFSIGTGRDAVESGKLHAIRQKRGNAVSAQTENTGRERIGQARDPGIEMHVGFKIVPVSHRVNSSH